MRPVSKCFKTIKTRSDLRIRCHTFQITEQAKLMSDNRMASSINSIYDVLLSPFAENAVACIATVAVFHDL